MSLAIEVVGLRKQFGTFTAVDGLDLAVPVGTCFGLLGPNGAGKTTTVEILEGLQTPTSGEVAVLGRRWAQDEGWLRGHIGVALQETHLFDKLTVHETLRLFRSFHERGRAAAALQTSMQLDEKRDARVESLSGGQRQRLAVACALAGDPELLFLDEPTTGLDPQSRRALWDVITGFKQLGRTVVLTTHYMDEAERLCDRVAVVDKGRVIALGSPAELIGRLGGAHVVELATQPPLAESDLSGVASVTSVQPGAECWLLGAAEPHVALPAVLARVAERGATLTRLTTRHATLEDVFVSLTGRQLRDG